MVNNLLFERQSGFRKGHDTLKRLITHVLHINADNGFDTRGVFLDIAGAFIAVSHYLLMQKLRGYGICGDVFNLIHSYLDNRSI
jgi:hypothetical protein